MFVSFFYLLMIFLVSFRFCCVVSFRFVSALSCFLSACFVSFLVLQSPVICFYLVIKKYMYVHNVFVFIVFIEISKNCKYRPGLT